VYLPPPGRLFPHNRYFLENLAPTNV